MIIVSLFSLFALMPLHVPGTSSAMALTSVWGRPSIAVRTAGDTVETDTTQLLLTDDALKHLTVLQASLLQEQDLINTYEQSHHVVLQLSIEVPIQQDGRHGIGDMDVTYPLVNIDALANKFPVIATAFTHTHLTPKVWREYRRSLFLAALANHFYPADQPPATLAKSITWKNVLFLRAHAQAIIDLTANGYQLPYVND